MMLGGVGTGLVRVGTVLACCGTAHAVVNARLLRRPKDPTGALLARSCAVGVSVLVPARDEAAHIVAFLAAVRQQDCAAIAEVLVLDDESRDDTARLAREVAHGDAHVRVLDGARLPAGWLGKPHACAQLAAAADPRTSVLVFVDADVRLAPSAVAAAVELLESSGLDLISPHPRQLAGSVAERLVQPLLQWSWLTTLPLRVAERSARPSLAAANGQFLVVRRDAYERAGGHAAVRDEVLDDLALLRAVKRAGGHGVVVDGSALASCRMYTGWGELRDGYGKSLWSAFGSPAGAAGVVGVLALAYVVPGVAALRGSRVGALGYLAAVAGRVVAARATGGRWWPDALAHPVSILAFGWLTGHSVAVRRRRTLSWKGRYLGPIGRRR
jgi:hypothetical protein